MTTPLKPTFFRCVYADAQKFMSYRGRCPAWIYWLILLFLTPGFQLVLSIRIQRALARIPLIGKFLRRVLWYCTTIYFNCDIDPHAVFGPGLYMPHPQCIVIGGECECGSDVVILQGVTIGRRSSPDERVRLMDNVGISAGAKVIGNITLGTGARVGANSVVLKDVPDYHIAVGVPARMLPPKSERTEVD
ncbi:MAG: hypothetical protein U0892_11500 [Pirellulales bacterium]